MSEVENRIVKLRFDNEGFERGVKASLATLDKLKESLKFENLKNGFSKLQEKLSGFNLNPMSRAVEEVGYSFDKLEMVSFAAINRMVNNAMSAGEKLVKALTVDNVSAGWGKYDELNKAKGTLITQGFELDEINEQLEKLNWFTDETSYNLTDMVSNIAKFTSTGQGLKQATDAIMGVANWSAYTGKSANEASRAMYQLSQAMANQALKGDDWKALVNLNMNDTAFMDTALEAAKKLELIKEEGEGIYKVGKKLYTRNEMFSKALSESKWLNTEVMMKTFAKYNSAVDGIYEHYIEANKEGEMTTSEVIETWGDEFDEFGLKAFKAGQEARSFADAIDATKDAVSTQWAMIFKEIFGDYDEAVKLWTGVSGFLYDIFAGPLEHFKGVVQEWKQDDGRYYAFEALVNIFVAIKKIVTSVSEAFREFFPALDSNILISITHLLRTFTRRLIITDESAQSLKNVFRGIFSILSLLVKVFLKFVKAILPVVGKLKNLAVLGLTVLSVLGNLVATIVTFIDQTGLLDAAFGVIEAGLTVIGNIIQFVINGLTSLLRNFEGLNILKTVLTMIASVLNTVAEKILWLGQKVAEVLMLIIALVAELVSLIYQKIKKTVTDILTEIGEALDKAKEKLEGFIESIKNGKGIEDILKKISDKFHEILDALRLMNSESTEGGFIQELKDDLHALYEQIKEIVKGFFDFFKNLDTGQVVALAFTAIFTGLMLTLMKFLNTITDLTGATADLVKGLKVIPDTFAAMKKGVNEENVGTIILDLAISVAILAGSLWLLSKIPAERLWVLVAVLGGMTTVMAGFAVALMALQKSFALDNQKEYTRIAENMLALAASVLIISGALYVMDQVDPGKALKNAFILSLLMLELSAFSVAMSKIAPNLTKGSLFMLAFSFSIGKFVDSLVQLTKYDIESINKAMIPLLGVMAGLSMVLYSASHIRITSALAMLLVVKVFEKSILPAFVRIANSEEFARIKDKVMANLEAVKMFVYAIAGVMAIGMIFSKSIERFTRSILEISLSLTAVFLAIKMLAKGEPVDLTRLILIFESLILVFAGVGGLMYITSKADDKDIKGMFGILMGIGIILAEISLLSLMAESIKFTSFAKIAIVFAAVTAAVAVLSHYSADTKDASILAMATALIGIGFLMGELVALSFISWEKLIPTAISLSLCIAALGFVFKSLGELQQETERAGLFKGSKTKGFGLGSMAIMAGALLAIAEIGAMFYLISKYTNDPVMILSIGSALAIVLKVLADFMEQAAKLKKPKKSAKDNVEIALEYLVAIAIPIGALASILTLSGASFMSVVAGTAAMVAILEIIVPVMEKLSNIKFSKAKATAFVIFGAMLGEIAVSLAIMAAMDPVNLLAAFGEMALLLYLMMAVYEKISNMKNLSLKKANSLIIMSAMVVEIGLSLAMVSAFNWSSILAAGGAIAGVLAVMIPIYGQFSKIPKRDNIIKQGVSLIIMSAVIMQIGASLAMVAAFNWSSILAAGGAIAGVLAVMIPIYSIMTKMPKRDKAIAQGVGLIIMSSVIVQIGAGLASVAAFNWQNILAAAVAVSGVLAVMIPIYSIMTKMPKRDNAIAQGIGLIIMSAVIVEIGASLAMVSAFNWNSILAAGGAIAGVLGVMIPIYSIVSNMPKNNHAIAQGVGLVIMSGILVEAGIALSLVAHFEWQNILAAGGAIAAVLGVMVGIFAIISGMPKNNHAIAQGVSIVIMGAVLVEAGMALSLLAHFEWERILASGIAMSMTMGVMCGLIAVMSHYTFNPAGLIIFIPICAMMITAAISLSMLANYNWDKMLVACGSMLGVIAIMGVAASILGGVGLIAAAGAGILAILGVDLIIFAAGLNVLAPAAMVLQNIDLIGIAEGLALLGLSSLSFIAGIAGFVVGAAGLALMVPQLLLYSVALQGIADALDRFSVEKLNDLSTSFLQLGVYAAEGLKIGVTSMLPQLLVLGTMMFAALHLGFKTEGGIFSPSRVMFQNGVYIVQGLINGIKSFAGGIFNLGSGLADKVFNGFEKSAQIHSPSIRAGEDGKYIVEGLVNGMDSKMVDAINAGQRLSDAALQGLEINEETVEDVAMALGAAYVNGSVTQEQITAVWSKYAEFGDGCSAAFRDSLNKGMQDPSIAESVDGAGDIVKKAIAGTAAEVAKDVKDISDEFKVCMDEAGVSMNDVSQAASLLGMDVSSLTGMLEENGATGANLKDMLDQITGQMSLTGEAADGAGYSMSFLGDQSEETLEIMKEMGLYKPTYHEQIQSLMSLGYYYDETGEKVMLTATMMQFLGTASEETLKETDWVNLALDQLQENLKKAKEAAGQDEDDPFSKYSDGISGVGSAAKSAKTPLEELTDTISNQMNIFEEFNQGEEIGAEKMLENMRSQIAGVSGWANNMATLAARGASKEMLEALGKLGPQGHQKVAAFVQMTDDQLREANDLFAQSMALPGAVAKDVEDSYAIAGKMAGVGFQNGVDSVNVANKIRDLGFEGLDALRLALDIHSPSKKTEEIGMYFIQGFRDGIENKSNRLLLVNKIDELASNVLQRLENDLNADKVYTIGKNLVEGLTNGISSSMKNNTSTIGGMFGSVISTVQSVFDTHSPSRVFETIGENLNAGLVLGLDGTSDDVNDSVSSMGQEAINNMNDMVNEIYELIEDNLDYEPVITPVLDLSRVQNGVAFLSDLFGADNVAAVAGNFSFNSADLQRQDFFNQLVNAMSDSNDKMAGRLERAFRDSRTNISVETRLEPNSAKFFKSMRQENVKWQTQTGRR